MVIAVAPAGVDAESSEYDGYTDREGRLPVSYQDNGPRADQGSEGAATYPLRFNVRYRQDVRIYAHTARSFKTKVDQADGRTRDNVHRQSTLERIVGRVVYASAYEYSFMCKGRHVMTMTGNIRHHYENEHGVNHS